MGPALSQVGLGFSLGGSSGHLGGSSSNQPQDRCPWAGIYPGVQLGHGKVLGGGWHLMAEGSDEVLGGWYLTAEVPWEVGRGLVPLCQEVGKVLVGVGIS